MVARRDVANLVLSSYFYAFNVWSTWASTHGCRVLPARPLSVATFLLDGRGEGFMLNDQQHRLSGNSNPCDDGVVVVDAAQRICPSELLPERLNYGGRDAMSTRIPGSR